MAVHIRLARHGSKKTPFYRIVVADQRSPRDGRFIENLGTFDPRTGDGILHVNVSRVDYWRQKGARTSSTLDRLLKSRVSAAPAGS
jgi:small subunit ribosomal protein S16